MTRTRSSRVAYSCARADDRVEIVEGVDLHAEVIERWRGERGIGGQQVDELAERTGVEDERVALLAGVVALGPAEHLAVEGEHVGAAALVEHRGIHADRDVVERRSTAHADTSGVTITLPGSSPAASRFMVPSTSSRRMSTGSIRRSRGSAPDASRSSAGRNPSAS